MPSLLADPLGYGALRQQVGQACLRGLATPGILFRLASWRPPPPFGDGRLLATLEGRGRARLTFRSERRDDRAQCLRRRTWLLGVPATCGASRATLHEEGCVAHGDTTCEYVVTWVERARIAPAAVAGLALVAMLRGLGAPAGWLLLVALMVAATYALERRRVARSAAAAVTQAAAAFHALVARASRPHRAPAVSIEPEGALWRIHYQGTTTRLRHSRGVALLAHLVRNPGCEIHVSALDAITPSGGVRAPEAGVPPVPGDAGEILDAQARNEYRRRAAELRTELAEAEADNDLGRIASLRAEQEMLEDELRSAVGANGRPRRASSDAERLRVAITHRIRDAIAQIGRSDPALGAHLSACVSTGYRCGYEPPAAERAAGERERKA